MSEQLKVIRGVRGSLERSCDLLSPYLRLSNTRYKIVGDDSDLLHKLRHAESVLKSLLREVQEKEMRLLKEKRQAEDQEIRQRKSFLRGTAKKQQRK